MRSLPQPDICQLRIVLNALLLWQILNFFSKKKLLRVVYMCKTDKQALARGNGAPANNFNQQICGQVH